MIFQIFLSPEVLYFFSLTLHFKYDYIVNKLIT